MKLQRLVYIALLIEIILLSACATNETDPEHVRKKKLVHTNVSLAGEYLQRNQLEFALEKIDKALELDPNDSDANNMMAIIQWRLNNLKGAGEHFERAVENGDKNAEAQNNYGAFLCAQGRIEEAIRQYDKALKNPLYKTPENPSLNAGLCLMKLPDRKRAEPYFRLALKHNPKLGPALYNMAEISFKRGKPLKARAFIQRFFAVAEDTPEALLLAVRIEALLKSKNASASYALRLRGKFPESKEAEVLRNIYR